MYVQITTKTIQLNLEKQQITIFPITEQMCQCDLDKFLICPSKK